MKLILENTKSGNKVGVTLPMNEDELLEVTSDVLGRDEDGRLLDDQEYTITDGDGNTYDSVFDLNDGLKA
jgi:hypothetical protein